MRNLDLYKDATWNGFSFWHGTSDIFIDSIRTLGLGAINAGKDFKLLELLKFLYNHTVHHDIDHPTLSLNRASIEAAIAQSDMPFQGGKLNYRHQHTHTFLQVHSEPLFTHA